MTARRYGSTVVAVADDRRFDRHMSDEDALRNLVREAVALNLQGEKR